jgi:hypothetical protein
MKVADLPKTRHPVDLPWILVRDGLNLPTVDQPILFVSDFRGSQEDEFFRILKNRSRPPEVRFGYVKEVQFDENFKEWYVVVGNTPTWSGISSVVGQGEHVTYWQPLPALPVDNYTPSEYSVYEISRMMQEEYETEQQSLTK